MKLHHLLFPLCVLADYKTVLTDIKTISKGLTTLDTSVQNMLPGIPGLPFALKIQVDAVNLDKHLLTGVKNAQASSAFGGGGSLEVGLQLIALKPKITSTLDQLSAKNTTFDELGIIVLASLYALKNHTDAFGAAILPKLDSLEAGIAPGVIKSIDQAFDGAIAAYRSQRL